MKKLFLMIGMFLVLFNTSKAEVLYDHSNVDGTLYNVPGGIGMQNMPASTDGIFNPNKGTPFYTFTGNEKIFRVKPLNTSSCQFVSVYNSAAFNGTIGSSNFFYEVGQQGPSWVWGPKVVGDYCEFTMEPSTIYGVPIQGAKAVDFSFWTNTAPSGSFYGSLDNGYTFDAAGGNATRGGIAFQICDAGGCSGGFTNPASSTPEISNINQFKLDGVTNIIEGATTTESKIIFKANLSSPTNNQVKLQVEIKPATQTFDETNIIESSFFISRSSAVATSSPLTQNTYHWRARAIDDEGRSSTWVEFGTIGNIDVNIQLASSILFIPGLEASRLYNTNYNGEANKLWEPSSDIDVKYLELDDSGNSIREDIYTKDVIDEKLGFTKNVYKSFLSDLADLKIKQIINDYGVAPYDWRLSLENILSNGNKRSDGSIYYTSTNGVTMTPYIIQELHRLAASSQTGKVTIVAHSNGGLVAKELMQKLGNTEASQLIDNIIFVAVPQTGTPGAVGAMLHGFDQGLPYDWFDKILSTESARNLVQNMPSVYNLLPSKEYFEGSSNSVITIDKSLPDWISSYGGNINSIEVLHSFLTDTSRQKPNYEDVKTPEIVNNTLLTNAEVKHLTLDTWTPPADIKLTTIAGWGEDTLKTIDYKKGSKPICDKIIHSVSLILPCRYKIASTLKYDVSESNSGDGTVIASSALWSSNPSSTNKYLVDLKSYNNSNFLNNLINRKHADILEIPQLRTLIKNIITKKTEDLPYISKTQPASNPSDNRLRFVLHSPLNLSAVDNLGNTISESTSTIPGSRFKRYGELQVITLPKGTPVTLNLNGYASGYFTLDLQEVDGLNNIIASSTIEAVPSGTSTVATISLPEGVLDSVTSLLIDYNGDSTTDFIITPKLGETIVFNTKLSEIKGGSYDKNISTVDYHKKDHSVIVNTSFSKLRKDITKEIIIKKSSLNVPKKKIITANKNVTKVTLENKIKR